MPTNGAPSPPIWVKVRVWSLVVQRHEVAADAGGGEAALRQLASRCRADSRRRTRGCGAAGPAGAPACAAPAGRATFRPAERRKRGEAGGDDLRRQLHQRRQQRRAGGVGLAADLRPLIGGQVVQRVADLRFDEAALLLHHQDRALAAGERAQALGLQRPGHRHLVERDLRVAFQVEHAQRVHRIGVRAPDGDDADRRIVAAEHAAVEPVGARPGKRGRDALLHHAAFQFGAVGGEAQARIVVQPMRRQREVRRDEAAGGRDDERGGLLGGLGGGLQRDPKAGETRQRNAGEAEVEDVLRPRTGSAPG